MENAPETPPEIVDTSEVPDIDAPIEAFAAVNVPSMVAEHVEELKPTDDGDTTDIFQWANATDAVKNELSVEFFLFNRNYTPYTTTLGNDLDTQIKPVFLYDLMN